MSDSMYDALFDEEINRLMRETCESLPKDYEIRLSLSSGEASLSLSHTSGNSIEVCTDDLDFKRTIAAFIEVAKRYAEAKHD